MQIFRLLITRALTFALSLAMICASQLTALESAMESWIHGSRHQAHVHYHAGHEHEHHHRDHEKDHSHGFECYTDYLLCARSLTQVAIKYITGFSQLLLDTPLHLASSILQKTSASVYDPPGLLALSQFFASSRMPTGPPNTTSSKASS